MTYMKCPICGETDTDKTEYENGLVIISCSNRDCASNGGSNYSFLKKTLDEKANPSLQLDIVHRGTSGIEIQALLSKKYSLIEYSLKAEPVPIFISPWMQFEPSEMSRSQTHWRATSQFCPSRNGQAREISAERCMSTSMRPIAISRRTRRCSRSARRCGVPGCRICGS